MIWECIYATYFCLISHLFDNIMVFLNSISASMQNVFKKNNHCSKGKTKDSKISLEPDSNQWPEDYCLNQLQSSALPTELSRGLISNCYKTCIYSQSLDILLNVIGSSKLFRFIIIHYHQTYWCRLKNWQETIPYLNFFFFFSLWLYTELRMKC